MEKKMNPATAVLLVPSQYKDSDGFLQVAKRIQAKFCPKSIIFRYDWDGKEKDGGSYSVVGGITPGFSADFWKSIAAADTFIPLCHCGLRDGPMLGPIGQQPWPTVDEKGFELTNEARVFWSRISWGLGSDGRILIAGCDSAQMYGPLVAKLMHLKVYGFQSGIPAAVVSSMELYIGGYFLKGRVGKNVVQCAK
jgi:hypothetical protein